MEMANGISEGQGVNPNLELTSSTVDAPQGEPVATAEERVFKQSEVNDIVKKVKNDAVSDYKRLRVEQPEYAQRKFGEQQSEKSPENAQHSNENNIDDNRYRQIAAEEAKRLRDEWTQDAQTKAESEAATKIVNNFWNKVNAGKEKYQDFDQVTGDIELNRFPNTVQLLAEYVDNSGDMLYELGKDRFKLSQLEQLALMSPNDAIKQAQRLSQSIKDNHQASNTKLPNQPLSQMRPSISGTESGVLSVKELRAKYRG